mgnify:FL=1
MKVYTDLNKGFERALMASIQSSQQAIIHLATVLGDPNHKSSDAMEAMLGDLFTLLGNFAITMGDLVIASGVAAAEIGNPLTAIPAGIGLAAIGVAILATVGAVKSKLSSRSSDPSMPDLGGGAFRGDQSPIDNSDQSPQVAGPRTFNVFIGNGAIVGGDGRAVGRDLLGVIDAASPSWRSS